MKKQNWEKEFYDKFVADDVYDCISELKWEFMGGEVIFFIQKRLDQQKQDTIDELVAEIFIRKDGILPLKNIFFKPSSINEIRDKLKKL